MPSRAMAKMRRDEAVTAQLVDWWTQNTAQRKEKETGKEPREGGTDEDEPSGSDYSHNDATSLAECEGVNHHESCRQNSSST